MHLTSPLTHTAQADRSAREFLGDDHPLVGILERRSAAIRHLVFVAIILVVTAAAWLGGARTAGALSAAAAVVAAILALRIACLVWLARVHACDLIIQGRADLPLDIVRRQCMRLLDRKHCDDLADWVDRTWTAAARSLGSRYQPHPLLNARVVRAVRPELAEIAGRLRENAPGVRGIALVERLLSEGGSPLHGGSVDELRQELRRIRFMLGA